MKKAPAACILAAALAAAASGAGTNVANVTGQIESLSERDSGGVSVVLAAARFDTAFDIVPDAKPFSVIASADSAKAVIEIDPTHNTYRFFFPVPTAAERAGNFSQRRLTVFDLLTCRGFGCLPFPGNVIPQSRLDPNRNSALNLLPLPNAEGGLWAGSENLPAPGRFSIANAAFGAFLQTAAPGQPSAPVSLSLYVDGILVAGSNAAYTLTR